MKVEPIGVWDLADGIYAKVDMLALPMG